MFKQKEIYYFDAKKCEYVKQERNLAYWLKIIALNSFYIILLTIIFLGVYLYFFDTPQTKTLKNQNQELQQMAVHYEKVADTLNQRLIALQKKDKELYRMILNAEPIDEKDKSHEATKKIDQLPKDNIDEISKKLSIIESKLSKSNYNTDVLKELAQKSKEELNSIPSLLPVESDIISGFGKRKSPITKTDKHHNGIDFNANIGTPVRATADGTVIDVSNRGSGLGLYVSIRHGHGYVSTYGCLSEAKVHVGKKIKKGEIIAKTGKSGLSKGPHLHYEITKNGKYVDPIDYLSVDLTPDQFLIFKQKSQQYNESMD